MKRKHALCSKNELKDFSRQNTADLFFVFRHIVFETTNTGFAGKKYRKGKRFMAENLKKVSDEALENVVGGIRKTVSNTTQGYDYANVRNEPNGQIVDRVYNGEFVYTTGRTVKRGGNTWCEVHYDGGGYGWVAANLLVDIAL